MRHIYLIRHGKIDAGRRCIGHTDLPLLESAKKELDLSCRDRIEGPYQVFSSPLIRTKETASYLFPEKQIQIEDALIEVDCGDWEGAAFSKIQEREPELYKKRGENPWEIPFPGGESMQMAGERLFDLSMRLLCETSENLVFISHAGLIRSYLCRLGILPEEFLLSGKMQYGEMLDLTFSEDGSCISAQPVSRGDVREHFIEEVFSHFKTADRVKQHGLAVARYADQLAAGLLLRGYSLDRTALFEAALLHDAARAGKDHPKVLSKYLAELGENALSEIIVSHHDLDQKEASLITEKMLLFYADKRVLETEKVTIQERFRKSKEKCKTEEALAAFEHRFGTVKLAEITISKCI